MNMTQQTAMPEESPVGNASVPIMRLISNDELDSNDAAAAELRQPQFQIDDLSAHVDTLWEAAKYAKNLVEQEMLMDYRQRQGIYEIEKLAEINEQGGSEIYIMLTSIKCAALEAWIKDVMMPADDRNWSAKPTPISDLPQDKMQEVMQEVMGLAQQALMAGVPGEDIKARVADVKKLITERVKSEVEEAAKEAADKMEDVIEDDLVEGGFEDALSGVISDLVTTKAGIMMGPVHRRRKTFKWEQDQQGMFSPVESVEIKKEYLRCSPFDIYPGPDNTSCQDGYLFHLQRLSPSDLLAMKGQDGFNDQKIDQVLKEYQTGGLREWTGIDQQRFVLEQKDNLQAAGQSRLIDTLSLWAEIPGRLLMRWGTPDIQDPFEEYSVNIWKVGRTVIGVTMNNTPLGKRPYGMSSFRKMPGAFWGEGLPHEIRDCQDMCNATGRAISNNTGMSSGPMIVYNDTGRIPQNEPVTTPYPWKIYQFLADKAVGTNRPPMEFVTIPNVTQQLMAVYEMFSKIADEVSNVPAYTYGNANVSGAAKTASGLSMLISQASKGIKHVIQGIDRGIIEPTVWLTFAYEMLYNPDPSIKGDIKIQARGSISLIAKEQQQIRRNEFLTSTANPMDMQIMGLPGRATVLREVAKSLEMPVDEIVPDPEQLQAQAEQGKMLMMVQNIAAATGIPPEQLIQIATQPAQQPGGEGGAPQQQPPQQGRTVDNAGNPVSGQDTRAFN